MSSIVDNISGAELSHITFNLKTSLIRNARMEGREYKVAPMVMILEGVHSGSQGALYYSANEIKKAVSLWDHKPIVVYHPTVNGRGVSACSPDVLTAQKVGVILNTKVDFKGPNKTARLVAEAWIEKDRASMVDKRVIQSINNHKTMELSTGLFMDVQPVQNGEWNGETYDAIARNYRPDHLALLPDKEGACSTKDGAGFIRNQKDGDEEDPNEGGEQEDELLPRDATIEPDEDDDDSDDPIDLGMMDNAKPDDASKEALGKSNDVENHLRERGDKANSGVTGLITKAGSFASRAVNAQSSQMAAIYHTKAARTYDKAHIANYRAKGPVKTSILAAKAGTAHYDAAEAHKGELTKNDLIDNGGPGSGRHAEGGTASGSSHEEMHGYTKYNKGDKVSDHFGRKGKVIAQQGARVQVKMPGVGGMHTVREYHPSKLIRNIEVQDDTKPKKKSGDSGAMGSGALIAGTIVGVTKSNPSVKKKSKGDQEQDVSVMEKQTQNGGPGSGRHAEGKAASSDAAAATTKAFKTGKSVNHERAASAHDKAALLAKANGDADAEQYHKNMFAGHIRQARRGNLAPMATANQIKLATNNLLSKNKTASGTLTGNANSQPKQNMKLNKKQQVDALIGNENSVWTEDEHDLLMSLNEKQVTGLYDEMTSNAISEDNNGKVIGKSSDEDEDGDDTVDVDGSKTLGGKAKTRATTETECANGKLPPQFAKKKKMADDEDDAPAANQSAEEYITNAPAEIRDILEEGLATRNQEKRSAIKTITANSANEFSKEELSAMPLKQLRSLAKLAANASNEEDEAPTQNRTLNFGGQALVIENEEQANGEILPLPTMNWSKDEIAANRGTKGRSA